MEIINETTGTEPAKPVTTKTPTKVNDFARFEGMTPTQLKRSAAFQQLAVDVINDTVTNLPEAKFLIQNLEGAVSNSIYMEVVSKIAPIVEWCDLGKGAEYGLANGFTINTLDVEKFFPTKTNDVSLYTHFATLTLPSGNNSIIQSEITATTWEYLPYFLSGKIPEYISMVTNQSSEMTDLAQALSVFMLAKTIFTKLNAKTSSTTEVKTNKLVGVKTDVIDCVREFKDFLYPMTNHNKVYAYNPDAGTVGKEFKGYNCALDNETIGLVSKETYNNLDKYSTTFLSKENVMEFSRVKNWVIMPETMFNPLSEKGDVIDLGIFNDADGKRVKGAILFIDRRGIRRLKNLEVANAEYFPKNMTTTYWHSVRYLTGILPWTQVGLYINPELEGDFVLPTKVVA